MAVVEPAMGRDSSGPLLCIHAPETGELHFLLHCQSAQPERSVPALHPEGLIKPKASDHIGGKSSPLLLHLRQLGGNVKPSCVDTPTAAASMRELLQLLGFLLAGGLV